MPRVDSTPVSLPHGRPSFNPDTDGDGANLCSQQWPDERTTGTNIPLTVPPSDTGDA